MNENTTAPTITIDGVTSKPGRPVAMLALGCGCFPLVDGHWNTGGDIWCDDCDGSAYVVAVQNIWAF